MFTKIAVNVIKLKLKFHPIWQWLNETVVLLVEVKLVVVALVTQWVTKSLNKVYILYIHVPFI